MTIANGIARLTRDLEGYLCVHGPKRLSDLTEVCDGYWPRYALESVLFTDRRFVRLKFGYWGVR